MFRAAASLRVSTILDELRFLQRCFPVELLFKERVFFRFAKADMVRSSIWREHAESFESIANAEINETRSDNLVYILLTIPGQRRSSADGQSQSVLDIALEQVLYSVCNFELPIPH